jgi:hypothetical protein
LKALSKFLIRSLVKVGAFSFVGSPAGGVTHSTDSFSVDLKALSNGAAFQIVKFK